MNILLTLLVFLNTPFYRAPIKEALTKIDNNIVWVYFTDKGFRTEAEYVRIIEKFTPKLSDEAIQRRINYSGQVFDYDDLPVYQKYVDEIVNLGGEVRTVSKWLNAASFQISPLLLERIYNLPFIYNITQVAIHTQEISDAFSITQSDDKSSKKSDTTDYRRLYGISYDQNAMLGIPSVFHKGYTGSRVKLAILDTGLKRKHNALTNLKIFREHDFLGGDNFFINRNQNITESIPNLRNINLANSSQIYKSPSNRLFIFYAADVFLSASGPPYKGLFYSYSNNQGQTWSNPQRHALTYADRMSIPNVTVTGKDSVVYVVWQDLLPQAPYQPITKLYLENFVGTNTYPQTSLGSGKNPHIFAKEDTLYITYTYPDSVLYLCKAIITNPYFPVLQTPVIIERFNEPIINPTVIVDSLNKVQIFALGLKSQIIYHYQSTSSNIVPIDSFAAAIKVQVIGNSIYLICKDYTNSPFIKLSLIKSSDGGNTWNQKGSITENLLTMGDFSFAIQDTIFVTYETQGSVYLTKSSDFSNTWSTSTLLAQDFLSAPKVTIISNQPVTIWLQRGDNNADYDSIQDFKEQPDHGTRMASIIAGYQPGNIVGTAPGVDLLITKTELYKTITGITYETTTEEDIWIQGLEWAEKEGAQIISSSLGYRSWYVDKDYDGRTIPVSIAAGLAAKRGVVVVSAMGNATLAQFPWPSRYIVAPGDAIGIITAGGVTKSRTPWIGQNAATGIGPTYDGRVKPNFVAMADTVIAVSPDSIQELDGSSGTSCATALIAGCAAVLLEAHPEWNSDSVKKYLCMTSSLGKSDFRLEWYEDISYVPNCTLGWGIPNIDSILKIAPPKRAEYYEDQLGNPYPNPFSNQMHIYFPLLLMKKPATAEIRIYTMSGELVKKLTLNTEFLPAPGRYGIEGSISDLENIGAVWNGENESGKKVSSGLYFALLKTSFGQDLKKFAVIR
jgi:hypothetical protein